MANAIGVVIGKEISDPSIAMTPRTKDQRWSRYFFTV
jgi:hypothetical protein